MNKKIVSIVLAVILSLGLVAGFAYLRTKRLDGCEKTLERFKENHACILTNQGVMVFELYKDAAPQSIDRFKKLSNEKKFYDGLEFYRVVEDFVVQGGIQDVQIRNSSGELDYDQVMKDKVALTEEKIDTESNFEKLNLTAKEKDELDKAGFKSTPNLNTRAMDFGALSFANTGQPKTNSTEFFIVTSRDKASTNVKSLNGKFTNMGRIIEGESVLVKLNGVQTDEAYRFSQENFSHPTNKIQILEIRVK